MLASAWAKKVPFLWAVLTPLGVMFAEAWVFHSGHIGKLVFGHYLRWMGPVFNIEDGIKLRVADALSSNTDIVTAGSVMQFFASPELWVGAVLAVGFVAGAIWLRRNRSEI